MSRNFARSNQNPCFETQVDGLTTCADVPLDLQQLLHRCLGRIDLAERLLRSFETRFVDELSTIEECLREEDVPRLTRLVHQLKGAAANVSAPALHASLTRMEQAVRAERPDEASRCLEEVRRAWERYVEFKATASIGAVERLPTN